MLSWLVFVWFSALPQAANFEEHARLGQYYLDRRDSGRAVSEFEAAARLQPKSATVHYNLGVALRLWGDLQSAESELRQALRLQPHFPEAHFVLGLVLGDRPGAQAFGLSEFEAAVEQNPSFADAHFNIGIIHWKSDEIERAVESFRRAVLLRPDSADFRFRLGQALARTGRIREAIQELERGIELDPAHESARYQLALAYRKLGDSAKAAALVKAMERSETRGLKSVQRDQSGLDYKKAMAALERGQLDTGIELLSQALKARYDEAVVRNALGIAYQRKGDLAAAIAQFRVVLELKPQSADARVNLGVTLMRTGDVSGAEREFRSTLATDPNFAEGHFNLGLALAAQKRLTEAAAALRASLRLHPNNARAHWNLSRVLRDSGDDAGAFQDCEAAWQLDQGLTDAGLLYGKLLLSQNKLEEALIVWRRALLRNPLNASVQESFLFALEAHGRHEDAERERRRFALLARQEYQEGIQHLNRGEFDPAIRILGSMLQTHPGLSEARRNLAFALFATRQYGLAAEEYQKLVLEDPTDSDLRLNLGIALRETPSLDRARQELEEAIRLNPQSAQAHYHLGLLYLAQKDHPRAMKAFHGARRLDPTLRPPQQAGL